MLEFRPFMIGHLQYMTPNERHRAAHAMLLSHPDYAQPLETNFGMSAWTGPGSCIGAAGAVAMHSHSAMGWALLSDECAPFMLKIVWKFRRVIQFLPYQRIEIRVAANYDAGHRFARAIGMKLETPEPMRMSGAQGEDEYLYSYVKWRH